MAIAAGEVSGLQERLTSRDAQLASLQQQVALLQLHVREAQRAQGAAAEAQAAASKALDQQDGELTLLRQQLKEAQVNSSMTRLAVAFVCCAMLSRTLCGK